MRNVITRLFAAVLVISVLASCASTGTISIPQQLPETLKAACDLYTKARPDVLAARNYAKAHWSEIPAEWKAPLLRLDGYLPELDNAGRVICAASDAAAVALAGASGAANGSGAGVNWDNVLSTVLKVVSIAADLKKSGAI